MNATSAKEIRLHIASGGAAFGFFKPIDNIPSGPCTVLAVHHNDEMILVKLGEEQHIVGFKAPSIARWELVPAGKPRSAIWKSHRTRTDSPRN